MKRKLLAILALLIVAAGMTAVSAFDLGDIFGGASENQTVTIDGVEFNIPDGFMEEPTNTTNEITETLQQEGANISIKTYIKDSTAVGIFVFNYNDLGLNEYDVLSLFGGNATKINNVDGFEFVDKDLSVFYYPVNESVVLISSTDENVIGDFIIA